jgi:hypothetical protein
MKPNDIGGLGCSGLPAMERCDAELPDNPQCAPNYHFGMLLGVEDFRAEQGFHLGQLRRHQRLLHGTGVVAGYPVSFDPKGFELRVGPGDAIDALGRDLVLDVAQCVSLPLWWLEHRGEDAFHDIATPDDATLDLDVMICYSTCLGSPVPAIAEPCAGDASDVAYSRVCETVSLSLVRTPSEAVPARSRPFHLMQMWLGLVGPRLDDKGKPKESDQWLTDSYNALKAMPLEDQANARAALLREVIGRAVAETASTPPEHEADEHDLCLPLARLRNVHIKLDPGGWTATISDIEMGVRESLLPTSFLQALLLGDPRPEPAGAGPVVVHDGATLTGSTLALVFSQALAPASVTADAFAVSEFIDATGWKPFTPAAPTYDETDPAKPTVSLVLDRAPTGSLVRVTVVGTGSTPLLGAQLIPAGAVHPDSEGRTLTTSIHRG